MCPMSMREQILLGIEHYAAANGLKPSTIGLKIFGDGKRYNRIKDGGGITDRTYERARAWFEERGVRFDELGKN